MYYISIDGNNIGKKLERYILKNDSVGLKAFSKDIKQEIYRLEDIILNKHGIIIMSGGDNIIAKIKKKDVLYIAKYLKKYNSKKEKLFEFSFSVGKDIISTYIGLKYAKSNHLKCGVLVIKSHEKFVFKEINI